MNLLTSGSVLRFFGCGNREQFLGAWGALEESSNHWVVILLMVQISGVHQLRLVVYPIICRVFLHPRW